MAFTAQDVKALREMTGCGMMDCKKALTETDGDKDKAVEYLREKGLSKAAKKADRIAAEGIVKSFIEDGVGVVVEVNSETDFVAKNEDFQNFVSDIAKTIAHSAPADVEALKTQTIEGGSQTVGEALTEKIATIGENMNIRRFERVVSSGVVVDYIHARSAFWSMLRLRIRLRSESALEMLQCRSRRLTRNTCQAMMFPRSIRSMRSRSLSLRQRMIRRMQASPKTLSRK